MRTLLPRFLKKHNRSKLDTEHQTAFIGLKIMWSISVKKTNKGKLFTKTLRMMEGYKQSECAYTSFPHVKSMCNKIRLTMSRAVIIPNMESSTRMKSES